MAINIAECFSAESPNLCGTKQEMSLIIISSFDKRVLLRARKLQLLFKQLPNDLPASDSIAFIIENMSELHSRIVESKES